MKIHYEYFSESDKELLKIILFYNLRYRRYIRAISAVNKDISMITDKGIIHSFMNLKLSNLPRDKSIIIYDRKGLVFSNILRWIDTHYLLNNYSITVISDYLYPEYISESLGKRIFSDFILIDASDFIKRKIINDNKNKLKFLLDIRDEFTKELIGDLAAVKFYEKLLHEKDI